MVPYPSNLIPNVMPIETVTLEDPFHCSFQHHHRLLYNPKNCRIQSEYRPCEVINIRSKIKSNSKPDFVIKFSGFCRKGQVREALHSLYAMEKQGIPMDLDVHAYLLEVCTNTKSLVQRASKGGSGFLVCDGTVRHSYGSRCLRISVVGMH